MRYLLSKKFQANANNCFCNDLTVLTLLKRNFIDNKFLKYARARSLIVKPVVSGKFIYTAVFQDQVVWCDAELQYFANQLRKPYLIKGSHLGVIGKCVERLGKSWAKLREIGSDLSYHLEALLSAVLDELTKKSRTRLLETIGPTEDVCQPYSLQTKTY